ncbi:bacteriohemerythrin [Candidatus Methylospira mobilis]|uniref:Bacteriohemerythrin n=1 Tax=Candidatus Methylospira mobilis TaxID=1808979 RepID=A0A5Q0BJB6_9GAMM|nr:bacteriohemerythrin [Candidatus Methylospira mobilis]QFY42248.1 bacteriohemerythrin [Candidatus Methylospira mobilis]WNV03267.1 bacteriohemerythrin [Candidatus Methylospira mobilis]
MSLITWSDFLSVEMAEIDGQHKRMVRLINGLDEHMRKGDANDIMAGVFNGIVEFAGIHFATEEQWMARYDFPGFPEHVLEHQQFTATAVELQNRFSSNQAEVTAHTMVFLQDWFYHHLLGTDKLLEKHLHAMSTGHLSSSQLGSKDAQAAGGVSVMLRSPSLYDGYTATVPLLFRRVV